MFLNRFAIVAAACAAVGPMLRSRALAEDLPTPASIIKRMEEAAKDKSTTPTNALAKQAQELRNDLPKLSENEAATRWLALVDEEAKSPTEEYHYGRDREDVVMSALPSPKAWATIAKQIEARPLPEAGKPNYARETALRFFGKVLVNDQAWVREHINELDQQPSRRARFSSYESNVISLPTRLLGTDAELKAAGDDFATRIEELKQGKSQQYIVQVPDLVTTVGAAKAEELLRSALSVPVILNVEVGDETRKLAQKLAVELVSSLRHPQWSLVTVNSPELFEALEKQFPPPSTQKSKSIFKMLSSDDSTRDDYASERVEATRMYWYSLVIQGKSDQAIALLKSMSGGTEETRFELSAHDLIALDEAAPAPALFKTVDKILAENPDLPLWDLYRSLAARTANTERLVELARASANREGLSNETKNEIRRGLAHSLLAADRTDEAVELYQSFITDGSSGREEKIKFGIKLNAIGKTLNKPELSQKGLATALSELKSQGPEDKVDEGTAQSVINAVAESGDNAEALDLIGTELGKVARQGDESRQYEMQRRKKNLLIAAAGIYFNVGKYAEVLELLRTVPGWGASDLKDILDESDSGRRPLGYLAAVSLAETGNASQAKIVLDALLDAEPGYDKSYELLNKLSDADALPKLEAIFASDRFQERPLIWKAEILRSQGKLADAEKIVREAIAIDPSDGEQPHGDRMRVYAVLASILEEKGDKVQAETYRKVVAAIRMSEQADDLYALGFMKRAIKLYEDSLTQFADAYCIQSRLAIKLMEAGRTEEAAKHYQKAFELMPSSFGRVESHCFGCEKAFAGKPQQLMAEQVFTRLLIDEPNKPQLHYLMGYLRDEQARYLESLNALRVAVKLDPEYLNAWKHISGLASHLQLPQADRDAAELAIYRLDPLGRHSSVSFEKVHDLKNLYDTVEATPKFPDKTPDSLMPLAAEKKGDQSSSYSSSYSRRNIGLTPGEAVGKSEGIAYLRGLMQVEPTTRRW